MLVLNRQPGSAVLIAGGIRIIILQCGRRGVRIGIEAPSSVGIVREEIAQQIADENRRATRTDSLRELLGPAETAPDPA